MTKTTLVTYEQVKVMQSSSHKKKHDIKMSSANDLVRQTYAWIQTKQTFYLLCVWSGFCICYWDRYMTRNVRKRTFWYVRETKTQISLRIRAVWLESSLSAWRNFPTLVIQNMPSEDSDQTARAQSDLNLRWASICEGTFPDVSVHMVIV